jgi:hypothetical protein
VYRAGVDYQGRSLQKYINLVDLIASNEYDEHDIGQREGADTHSKWHQITFKLHVFQNTYEVALDKKVVASGDVSQDFKQQRAKEYKEVSDPIPVAKLRQAKYLEDEELYSKIK